MRPRDAFSQSGFDVRFEWGVEGLHAVAKDVAVVVTVDVLSFATALDVAVGRGALVYPAPWRGPRAHEMARRHGAALAAPRDQVSDASPFSLSPMSLAALRPGDRLVLPSPNGARLALDAAQTGATVLSACLRNATAAAERARRSGGTVAVVAAGERWPGGALRPSLEDALGAGAVLAALSDLALSPEARAALAVWRAGDPGRDIPHCSSARELQLAGFGEDVDIACETDVSTTVPAFDADGFFAT